MTDNAATIRLLSNEQAHQPAVDPKVGLTSVEVRARQEKYGLNSIGDANTKSNAQILFDQFKSLLTLLLVAAAALSFAFSETEEAVAILVVIAINTAVGYWAEHKATRSMTALRLLGRTTTRVRRDGQVSEIAAEYLVPGDIVLLAAGDIVTADMQLLDTVGLQCDESLLTGESVPVNKIAFIGRAIDKAAPPETTVFKGTAVTRGGGTAIVTSTGRQTRLGEIATLTETAKGALSPLERRLQTLSEQLLIAVFAVIVALTVGGVLVGRDLMLMAKTGIALSVAAIPEGLPIVATLALARGMWKLAAKNALIERLSAVETLGSVNIIFADKTGTLTKNEMTVTNLHLAVDPDQNSLLSKNPEAARALRICGLCYSGQNPENLSDPMEAALLRAAKNSGLPPTVIEKTYPRIREEAFDPNVRMMATVHKTGDAYYIAVKGAPEAVIESAKKTASAQGDIAFDEENRQIWLAHTNQLARRGLRVLALAEKQQPNLDKPVLDNLTFLGLVGLEDPARPDAVQAVKAAQAAGVRVIMVTGDNAATAMNIAAAVGIVPDATARAVEGGDFVAAESLTEKSREKLLATNVFARMSPREKLELIDLHQLNGAVVAMTGDGVNDAPALKKADVGIAMGVRGTQVARQAAAMILRDDAFASIILAIQQGRVIFANIRKFVIYLLSCNLSEVLVVTLAIAANLPLPLLPLQILFLNLVTDVFPALALGFGEADKEILNRAPRPKYQGLLQPRHWRAIIAYAVLMTIPVMAAFVWALMNRSDDPQYATTVAFMCLALTQLWHVFNMRSRKAAFLDNQVARNPFVWAAILLCLLLLALALLWPPLSSVLGVVPLDATTWMVILFASLFPFVLAQIGKHIKIGTLPVPQKSGAV